MNIETVGYLATAIIAFQLTPQIIKSYKTKSTTDISFLWTLTYILGLILWIIYGIGIESKPLTVSATIETGFALTLLTLKIKYK
ncbi:MAG: hypothetical protein UR27_C0021G0035 [Candidatus Peregrinibacteria bacterium GW2011_GWA2_33_10]|nr:MAG: hypothetical protein UR27_C0021G0035 [Candidatus Peregrinibacteria bacterium GW2011_GWA2_33_10]KKP40982.1 MAG: hypothetical protein UR30_C0002G0016 [Candidatus Peregrinibacteria bacterium GW2011_GWC2_33_13]OGJ48747.1 MAG: hypothetical protein A2229_01020 [Candidatus Peregrinibacteria bacterium RIFOXYA2_FULL_33_7]